MKKLALLTSILFLTVSLSYSQIDYGSTIVGGTGSLSIQNQDDDDFFSLTFSPVFGKFIFDRFAVGGAFSFGYLEEEENSLTSYALGAFLRQYFGKQGKPMFFLQAEAGFLSVASEIGSGGETGYYGGGPGVTIFLSEEIAIESVLKYERFGKGNVNSQIGIFFGVQAYLGRKW